MLDLMFLWLLLSYWLGVIDLSGGTYTFWVFVGGLNCLVDSESHVVVTDRSYSMVVSFFCFIVPPQQSYLKGNEGKVSGAVIFYLFESLLDATYSIAFLCTV